MNVLSPSFPASGSELAASSRGSTGKADDKQFDKLLQSKPQAETTGSAGRNEPSAAGRDDGVQEPEPAEPEASQSQRADKPTTTADEGSDEPVADAPWPPPGLAVMLAAPADPAPVKPALTGNAAAATPAQATPALPALPATATPASEQAAATAIADDATTTVNVQAASKALFEDADTDAPAPTSFAPLLQGQSVQDVRSNISTAAVAAPTPTPDMDGGDFDDAIGARVTWLAEQKIGHAHIRITPDDMGQIDVKLQLDGDRVHASFSAANADVRHALEGSLPRLREMLAEQGLQLSHADVGQQSTSQQQGGKGDTSTGLAVGNQPDGIDLPTTNSHKLRLRGLLDAYA